MELRIEILGADHLHTRFAEELLGNAVLMDVHSDPRETPIRFLYFIPCSLEWIVRVTLVAF